MMRLKLGNPAKNMTMSNIYRDEFDNYQVCVWKTFLWCYSHSVDECIRVNGLDSNYQEFSISVPVDVLDVDDYIQEFLIENLEEGSGE